MSKKISVIIPNYNGRHLMQKHLPAVLSILRKEDEVIIVDDHSSDDSVQWLKKEFSLTEVAPDIYSGKVNEVFFTVLYNQKNMRFGASCNRGVLAAKNELILLLNTDVRPHRDILQYLIPHFDDAQVFAVGCREEEHGENVSIQGGKNTLKFMRGMFIHARASEFSSGETAWVSGGSGMFNRQKWLEIGGFDSLYYPAYWEDVDLSFQARKRGWKILFESRAVVDHNHESTNKDAFGQKKIENMSWRNANKFVEKNGNISQKILHILWLPYWCLKRR
jgi:GT2 family glycosyltransferase